MADQKISQLTADTTPTTDDLLVTVNDPAGTPGTKKVTASNFVSIIWAAVVAAASGKTTIVDADLFSIVDSAASNVIKALSWLNLRGSLHSFATTATAAGTTTLTVSSARKQEFTGTTTQTITLPVVSTLFVGYPFTIINSSTGVLTINSSGGNLVKTLRPGATAQLTAVLITGTTAASWSVEASESNNTTYTSTVSGSGGSAGTYAETVNASFFEVKGKVCRAYVVKQITDKGSWSGDVQVLLPITPASPLGSGVSNYFPSATVYPNGSITPRGVGRAALTTNFRFEKTINTAFLQWADIATNDWIVIDITYPIA